MTPHTTNRLTSLTALDLFGGAAGPAAGPDAESGFESALKEAAAPPRSAPAAARYEERDPALTRESRQEERRGSEMNSNRLTPNRQKPASDVDHELVREGAAHESGPVDPQSSASHADEHHDAMPEADPSNPESDESQESEANDGSNAALTPAIGPLLVAPLPFDDESVATEPMVFRDAEKPRNVDLAVAALPAASQTGANIAAGEELLPSTVSEQLGHSSQPESGESGAQPLGSEGFEVLVDPLTAIEQNSVARGADIQEPKQDTGETALEEPAIDSGGISDSSPIPAPTDSAADLPPPRVSPPDRAAPLPKESEALPAGNSKTLPDAIATSAPHRLPEHVLSRSEGMRGHSPATPVDSARFLSRVARAFIAAQQRDGEIRLRLSPPELGSLRLQVSVQEGVMTARLETETEAARTSLVNHLPALRERLEQQGIRVERFDIDLMQRPSTGTPDRPSDPQQQDEMPHLRSPRVPGTAAEPVVASSNDHSWNGQGRLNVII